MLVQSDWHNDCTDINARMNTSVGLSLKSGRCTSLSYCNTIIPLHKTLPYNNKFVNQIDFHYKGILWRPCMCITSYTVFISSSTVSINPLSNNCLSIAIVKSAPTLRSFPVHTDWLPVYEGLYGSGCSLSAEQWNLPFDEISWVVYLK